MSTRCHQKTARAHDETSKKQVKSSVPCISNALLPNDLHADVAMSLQESNIQRMQKKLRGQGLRMGERPLCLRPFTLNFFFLMGAWDTLSTQVLLKGKEKKKEKKKNKGCKLWSTYIPGPEFQINHLLAAQVLDKSPLWIPSLCPVEIKNEVLPPGVAG